MNIYYLLFPTHLSKNLQYSPILFITNTQTMAFKNVHNMSEEELKMIRALRKTKASSSVSQTHTESKSGQSPHDDEEMSHSSGRTPIISPNTEPIINVDLLSTLISSSPNEARDSQSVAGRLKK